MRIKAYLHNLLGPVSHMSFTVSSFWLFLSPCIVLVPVHILNSSIYHCNWPRTSFSIFSSSHPGTSFNWDKESIVLGFSPVPAPARMYLILPPMVQTFSIFSVSCLSIYATLDLSGVSCSTI